MLVLFAISKAIKQTKAGKQRGPVKLSRNRADLQKAIESLQAPKEERRQRRRQTTPTRVSTERTEDHSTPEVQLEGSIIPPVRIDSLPA